MAKRYNKGRRAEYDLKHILEQAGYEVTRSAGSHGAWDLVAVRRTGRTVTEIGLIQVKCSKTGGLLPTQAVKGEGA